ncbi:hypothetical protein J7E29_05460 [Streptomyces sp. ISL-90]|nr:hypothetical protein [Streptomyces sp. ISL-90]
MRLELDLIEKRRFDKRLVFLTLRRLLTRLASGPTDDLFHVKEARHADARMTIRQRQLTV